MSRTTDYGYAGLQDFCYARQRTTDNGQRSGGSRWSFAGIMELRIGRVGSKLKAQSLSILSILSIPFYTLYTLYTHSSKKTTTNMEYTEIKRYTKKELALLYFPNISPATARRHLIRWIMRNSKLMEELYAANYSLSDQYLTKEQVEIIFRYIGPP